MNSADSTLDTTISALQGGLTSIDATTAVSVIDTWQQTLSGAGLTDIADDLGQLKTALTSSNLDGAQIGEILSRLGSKTSAAAGTAPAEYESRLQQLGQLLSQSGTSLNP
jgi:ABC-type transporter Mla subunit MlaD